MLLNIVVLKSTEDQDPWAMLKFLRTAHIAATKEEGGYTIIKDRFNSKYGVEMTHQEFWTYVSQLEQEWV